MARRFTVHGRVQGVGFRLFARDQARRLGLTGYVRNLPDGRTLEALAEGPPDALLRFEDALRRGPPGAHVRDVTAEAATLPPDLATFDVW